jgi:CYTH domain-containing protein
LHDNRYFELDIYPFNDEYAILEIELNSIDEEFNLPNLEIVKNVTWNKNYTNYNLAKTLKLD